MPQTTGILKNSQFHYHEIVSKKADDKSNFTVCSAIS